MVALLRPALLIMNRLKFPQKFLLVSLLFALPLSLTTFYFVHDINADIDFAAKERLGVVYIRSLCPLIEHLQLLRGATYRQPAAEPFFAQQAQQASWLLVTDIQTVDAANGRLGKTLEAESAWQKWKSRWTAFQEESAGLTRRQRFDRCTELIAGVISLVSQVGDSSNLILDPDLDSYYLMESAVNRLPSVAESLGVMRGQHSVFPNAENPFSEEKRLFLLGQATKEWESVQRGLNVVYTANVPLKAAIEPQTRTLGSAFQDIAALSGKAPPQPMLAATLPMEDLRLFSIYTNAIRATFAEHTLVSQILDSLLAHRINQLVTKRNRILALTLGTVTLVVYFLTGFYLSIRRMVDSLVTTTTRMLAGEKAELVLLENRDEMAQVAASFNQICLALQATATELQSNNQNLEEIVVERTRQMEYQAFHDALTGLPNRPYFLGRLEEALQKTKRTGLPIAVLFLDLDNFKTINDSLGHEAGDKMLQAISERLLSCIWPGDTVARLGGDEFTLLLENVQSVEEAVAVTERIIAALHQSIKVAKNEIFPSGSIGIAFTRDVDRDADGLLRDADTAMYHAKGNGKAGYAVYDSTMSEKVVERMQLETALRFALERNEFVVHYQPLVNLETGQLSGAEALIRWNHPTLGLTQPAKFLPIAEETGLIVPIGYWVLEEACRQTKLWQKQYPDAPFFTINVNLSGRQLQREDVVERVREALEKTGLDPSCLKLEITESVMMEDVENTVSRLHGLKALGVKLALDDFGTGYSSMASLNLFPLDTVKIDRSFINRLAEQEQAVSIVAAIISLSRALNMDVTGEGIETQDHVTFLQSMGCQIGQGYFFARPISSDDMEDKINGGHAIPLQSQDAVDLELIERLLKAA